MEVKPWGSPKNNLEHSFIVFQRGKGLVFIHSFIQEAVTNRDQEVTCLSLNPNSASSQLCELVCYLTSLGLSFSICKMGTVIVVVRIKCIIHVKHSEKCLAHNKHSVHVCCCCLYLEHLPESERIGAQHGCRE